MSLDQDTRLEKLETDLAHANVAIEDLNSVVIAQGKQIQRLERLVSRMTDQVEELAEQVLPAHPIEKPPHY